MEEGSSSGQEVGLVILSEEAEWDVSEIHLYTSLRWGLEQADHYVEHLIECARKVAKGELPSDPVDEVPPFRAYLVRWRGAKAGHRLIYQQLVKGIYVVAVFHTSMNIDEHISARLRKN